MTTKPRATVEDLYNVPERGKAELVNGELVLMSPTGGRPGRAAAKILISLSKYEDEHGGGYAFGDAVGFLVDLPNRGSFCPDAAWYVGQLEGMKFLRGAPVFAVEVRSESGYGPKAEQEMAGKRRDYFAAGTRVVWDVDLLGDEVVRVYRASDPDRPSIYRRRDQAEAEPAVPGWRLPVDELFK
ncbi:MAG: Uma2 family endonuclease [Acidobacteria bacterium]|nr:Uma2 family endonuclease [Acidobacteriota bacterium]